jgi:SNF2 family DNA or RNA helicase
MGRESNQGESPRMLWHVEDSTSGVPRHVTLVTHQQVRRHTANFGLRFRHKITGARSQTPDDILGGILADDMGLGKTLTMIATIVTAISRAEHFATTRFTDEEGIKDARIPVMSTLVIVPSVCQYA